MLITHFVLLSRIVIGSTFAFSFASKIVNLETFARSVSAFRLLPQVWVRPIVNAFLIAEFIVATLCIIGGEYLGVGFFAASILLTVFSIALIISLIRKRRISCNCFGPTQEMISPLHVLRNGFLILLSTLALYWIMQDALPTRQPEWIEALIVIVMAMVIFIFTINVGTLSKLIQIHIRS